MMSNLNPHDQTPLNIGGKQWSSSDLYQRGVNSWDTPADIEVKDQAYRKAQVRAMDTRDAQKALNKSTATSNPKAWLAYAIAYALISGVTLFAWTQVLIHQVPDRFYLSLSGTPKNPHPTDTPALLKPYFAPAFKAGTDLDLLFSGCANKGCTTPDFRSIQKMRPMAEYLDDFDNRICQAFIRRSIAINATEGTRSPFPGRRLPDWSLVPLRSPQAGFTHTCDMKNAANYRAVLMTIQQEKIAAIAGFWIIAMIAASVGIFVFKRNRAEKGNKETDPSA